MSPLITSIIIVISLVVGFGVRLYFGETKGEAAEAFIEKIVKVETGIDLEPIFDIDNDVDPKNPA